MCVFRCMRRVPRNEQLDQIPFVTYKLGNSAESFCMSACCTCSLLGARPRRGLTFMLIGACETPRWRFASTFIFSGHARQPRRPPLAQTDILCPFRIPTGCSSYILCLRCTTDSSPQPNYVPFSCYPPTKPFLLIPPCTGQRKSL